ncbi:MAG TPA: type II toxin-antitoxin system RelE/ParE family toxin [Candidatus Angelobacter sp.]|nr:type II toxin-antitoxin system RelE/ParE family toxin [Candidatus Angelobacter sp.]
MRLEILDLAKDDLIDGYRFYERSEEGLGNYFLVNLYSDIERLKFFGGIHRRVHGGFFRALSKRFPFAIYYTVEEKIVRVRAVVDCRRNPSWLRKHLKKAG